MISMIRQDVSSSNIRSVGYDNATRILEIEFHSEGRVYQYSDVSEDVYTSLMDAPSKGKYFAAFIKDKYSTTKIR